MGDAEIIPLGTRGRPGRGSGRERPSASSRDLAASARSSDARVDEPTEQPVDDADTAVEEPTEVAAAAIPTPLPTGTPMEPLEALDPADEAVAEPPVELDVATAATTSGSRVDLPFGELLTAATRAAQVVFGEDADQKLAQLLAFLRRRVTGDYAVDEYGMDPEITERFLLELVRPLATKWFRVEVRGVENIPTDGGALVVANHSGTIPVDGLVTMFAVHETTGRNLRPLGADLVFKMPFIGELARKGGATLACNEDAVRMLSKGELAAVWPEGFKGVGKPYSERYKLQRFGRGGFVSAAIRTGVPIVPCSIVGAEEIYPLVGNIPILARLLGVPYIPVTPFFPLLGPLGLVPLPSKWIIEFGEPIRTDSYDPGAADDPMLVFNVTDQVRETIQQTLYSLLMRRKSIFH
jgi:1-acyl-sn-glycerol-3-phosphate acyltransferase